MNGWVDDVPRSPSGRVPQWVLDEALGRPVAPPDPWRAWQPPTTHRRRRARRIPPLLVVTLVVAVGLGASWLVGPAVLGPEAVAAAPTWPTPGVESDVDPLGVPAVTGAVGPHLYTAVQEDGVRPVAYDPCRPIHYVVRPDNAPAGGDAVLAEAIGVVSSLTGLQFVSDGTTDESPSQQRTPFQPDRYGDRWAPVLLSWDTDAETPEFSTDVVGLGGSSAVADRDGERVYVTGMVELDAAWFAETLAMPDGGPAARAVVMHELGHLVGLDHVAAPDQLMAAANSGQLDFGAGDLEGLAELGRGACAPTI